MNTPFSIVFNDHTIKISFFPEGDLAISAEGKSYRIDEDQVQVLRAILNNIAEDPDSAPMSYSPNFPGNSSPGS